MGVVFGMVVFCFSHSITRLCERLSQNAGRPQLIDCINRPLNRVKAGLGTLAELVQQLVLLKPMQVEDQHRLCNS
jgi:hypothetical protein